ncbi:MAG TPA: urease accessory UreF family protein [Armatimonadota bacterium]|nr:urease accessory UreF family protein [Armatimonadota bacterium]
MRSLTLSQLLHISDSALPIGSASHSFGLETLVADGALTPADLKGFFADFLVESGALEGAGCLTAYRIASARETGEQRPPGISGELLTAQGWSEWLNLNCRMSARRAPRESRDASSTLGRRFLKLLLEIIPNVGLRSAMDAASRAGVKIHHCTAFGLVGGSLDLGAEETTLACIQQTLKTLISACQRLLPLGQVAANALLWNLQSDLIDCLERVRSDVNSGSLTPCFTPMLEMASMRHPLLSTRLFIS